MRSRSISACEIGCADICGIVIEDDFQARITDALHHFAVGGEDAVIGDVLVVERRQHHHGVDADRERVARQRDGVAERGNAGAGQKPPRRDAGGHHRLEQRRAFGHRKGVRLTRRAQHRDAVAAFVEQIATMVHEARMIGSKLGVERRQRGGEHAMRVQR